MNARSILFTITILFMAAHSAAAQFGEDSSNMQMGIPMSLFEKGSGEANTDICPAGARVVMTFISSWLVEDYDTMYELLDDGSKENYTLEQARFDFRMLEAKPYKISSVRETGENYEFIISHGAWEDGDKDVKKMIINGNSFKIMMQSGNSPFKTSAADLI